MNGKRTAVFVVAGWVLSAQVAVAQIACGQTITGNAVMDSDLNCLGFSPAIVIDGGSLDMAGHRIIGCAAGGAAIIMINTGGSVKDGVVMSCTDGIRLGGTGGHTIKNVIAKNNSDTGFQATSSNNKLIASSAFNNGGDGFHLGTPFQPLKTKVQGCIASNNGGDGFQLDGDQNTLTDDVATGNMGSGIYTNGDGNKIKRSNVAKNGGTGIYVDGGTNGTTVERNSSSANTYGIAVFAAKSKVKNNVCMGNDSDGLLANAPDLLFTRNVAVGNAGTGIDPLGNNARIGSNTSAASGNQGFFLGNGYTDVQVSRNRALGNGGTGIYFNNNSGTISRNTSLGNSPVDADDGAVNCGADVWSNNLLGSKADACIQ